MIDPFVRCDDPRHDHDSLEAARACVRFIGQDDLAKQREQFALDSVEDRPYHHLAAARVRRGQPWNRGLDGDHKQFRRDFAFWRERLGEDAATARTSFQRMYPVVLPLDRAYGVAHEDRARWSKALAR